MVFAFSSYICHLEFISLFLSHMHCFTKIPFWLTSFYYTGCLFACHNGISMLFILLYFMHGVTWLFAAVSTWFPPCFDLVPPLLTTLLAVRACGCVYKCNTRFGQSLVPPNNWTIGCSETLEGRTDPTMQGIDQWKCGTPQSSGLPGRWISLLMRSQPCNLAFGWLWSSDRIRLLLQWVVMET